MDKPIPTPELTKMLRTEANNNEQLSDLLNQAADRIVYFKAYNDVCKRRLDVVYEELEE